MKLVTAYLRPHKLEEVKTALSVLPISGLTTADARGCGNNPEAMTEFFGQEILVTLPVRSKLEVACSDDLCEEVVEKILESSSTGQPGDGKIFVESLTGALRIRTLERDQDVV